MFLWLYLVLLKMVFYSLTFYFSYPLAFGTGFGSSNYDDELLKIYDRIPGNKKSFIEIWSIKIHFNYASHVMTLPFEQKRNPGLKVSIALVIHYPLTQQAATIEGVSK